MALEGHCNVSVGLGVNEFHTDDLGNRERMKPYLAMLLLIQSLRLFHGQAQRWKYCACEGTYADTT